VENHRRPWESIWADIQRIRADAPLVHNITNYVVMNTTANALLRARGGAVTACLGAAGAVGRRRRSSEECSSTKREDTRRGMDGGRDFPDFFFRPWAMTGDAPSANSALAVVFMTT